MKSIARAVYRRLRPGRKGTNKLEIRDAYSSVVKSLRRSHGDEKAMSMAVGGEFEAVGLLELETLKYFGMKEDSYVIDVGCGSGRLAAPLSRYLKGRYLGTDIVPELLAHARKVVNRPDWRFEAAPGLTIPEEDDSADIICFFSVFTHLLHEQSYVYLQEAKRVLKPGGKVIFSFLDFTVGYHWPVFEYTMKDVGVNARPLNVFMSKDAVRVWAEHLGLGVEVIFDGDVPFVPLPQPIIFEDGSKVEGMGTIGQSVCALLK